MALIRLQNSGLGPRWVSAPHRRCHHELENATKVKDYGDIKRHIIT